jgi:Gpi18-like mannosyltransferase
MPSLITSLANFDGVHYVLIAKNGYAQYTQAFFPLYPLLIRGLGSILNHNYLVAGVVLSVSCFAVGIIYWKKFLDEAYHDSSITFWSVVFLLTYPTAFFFNVVYTEALFFLIVAASLYYIRRNKLIVAGVFAALASFTRLAGIFLIIPFGIYAWVNRHKKSYVATLYMFVAPCAGFAIYAAYLWITTGDPFYFYHSQPAFGAHRSTHIILLPQVIYRYLKIFYTAAPNFQYYMSVYEFVMFHIVFVTLCVDLFFIFKKKRSSLFPIDVGLSLFSLANLMIPTLTGTFSAIPRYSLLSLAFYIALARLIPNTKIKTVIAVVFTIAQIITFAYFLQGYFVS